MANTTATILKNASLIAKAAATEFADNLKFCNTIGKADAGEFKGKNGFSAGQTISINKPFVPTVGDSLDLTSAIQDFNETKVDLTLDIPKSVGISLDSQELAHDIDMKAVYKRIVSPTVSAMAQEVERTMLERAALATHQGALLTDVTAATTLAAKTALGKQLAPFDNERCIIADSEFIASAVTQRNTLFNSSTEVSDQYKTGQMGKADGFKWMENNLLASIETGNDVTGVAVDGVVATGATTLPVDGVTSTSGTIKKGQQFTIAGVYAVHPITKATQSNLQNFVATSDVTADAGGNAVVGIYPTIYDATSGGLQTVSVLPADDAAVTFIGAASSAYTNNLAYHKDAFRMASVPLVLPTNAEFAVQETHKGVTVRIVRDWEQKTGEMITRVDFLGGFVATRPEFAYRFLRA